MGKMARESFAGMSTTQIGTPARMLKICMQARVLEIVMQA